MVSQGEKTHLCQHSRQIIRSIFYACLLSNLWWYLQEIWKTLRQFGRLSKKHYFTGTKIWSYPHGLVCNKTLKCFSNNFLGMLNYVLFLGFYLFSRCNSSCPSYVSMYVYTSLMKIIFLRFHCLQITWSDPGLTLVNPPKPFPHSYFIYLLFLRGWGFFLCTKNSLGGGIEPTVHTRWKSWCLPYGIFFLT